MLQDPFVFLSNRGSKLFAAALSPLGGRVHQPGDAAIDLLYFDQYGGELPPADVPVRYSLMERQRTIPLDDKAEMAFLLQDAGIDYPAVYFDPASVPRQPGAQWYVKLARSTAGKGIAIADNADLDQLFEPGSIIQEAVQDLVLIDRKKFTLRMYLLVHRGRVYLYEGGIIVLHGAPYEPDSRDPAVQFRHDGYMRSDSPVRMFPLTEYPAARDLMPRLAQYLAGSFTAFRNLLAFEDAGRYCVFGVDLLLRRDFEPVMVEVNDRPNFVHTARVNAEVNVPMLRSLWLTLTGQDNPDDSPQQFRLISRLVTDDRV